MDFIERSQEFGVEPICEALQFAPATYYAARNRSPSKRAVRDEQLKVEITRVFAANFQVYGARKIWAALRREGFDVARCTVERLMRELGIRGALRGKRVRTTLPPSRRSQAPDVVQRTFRAQRPNRLWVADFTYCSTWKGFVYTAFIIDVFSRKIVGWRTATSMSTDLVLDALDMALWARPDRDAQAVCHSDRGVQYTSIAYTERLAMAGIQCSVGSVGDSYDNALAESTIGLYKTELVTKRGPWRTVGDLEIATFEWIDWYNNHRLHTAIGNIPPTEFETTYYANTTSANLAEMT